MLCTYSSVPRDQGTPKGIGLLGIGKELVLGTVRAAGVPLLIKSKRKELVYVEGLGCSLSTQYTVQRRHRPL